VAKDTMPDEYSLTAADKERFASERQRGFLALSDPRLRQRSQEVAGDAIGSRSVQRVIQRLHEVAEDQRQYSRDPKKRRTLVGLAAPQIGEMHRIILIDTLVDETRRRYGRLECFINPVIVWRTRETTEGREGCFSAGPVWGLVRRPLAVKMRAFTPQGKEVERILEGFTARIACHEIDHLDGIRFPERITADKKRHWVHTEELLDYPTQIGHWPRLCTPERWHELSGA